MQTIQYTFVDQVMMDGRPKRHIILPPPKIASAQNVFSETMLDTTSAHQRRSPMDWAISVLIHAIVVTTLLVIPLYFNQGLDIYRYNLTFLAAPMPPAGPPPPPLTSSAPRVLPKVVRAFVPGRLIAPSFIPKVVATTSGDATPPEAIETGVPGGVPGGFPGGQLGGVLGGVLGGAVNAAPPPVMASEGPKKPVVIGGDVRPPRLIFGPQPDYPVLARQSRIFGIVEIEAIIDEHGDVIEVRAIKGHPLLIPAALKAVSLRKYEPTILDGQPTPIDLRVEVKFSMS